jgi:hypothetical protein
MSATQYNIIIIYQEVYKNTFNVLSKEATTSDFLSDKELELLDGIRVLL